MLPTSQVPLDLNLLLCLNALLTHGSVTRAADTLGVTQSAMSRSLARLREAFDDPLFVRAANKLAPTPRAEALRTPLNTILQQIDQLVVPTDFDPAKARGRFRLACVDFAQTAFLPGILPGMLVRAPQLGLDIATLDAQPFERLGDDGADLLLALSSNAPADVYQRVVFRDRLCCALRADHPALRAGEGMNVEQYCRWQHMQLQLGHDMRRLVEDRLLALGAARQVSLQVSQIDAAMTVLVGSDLILTAPEHMLRRSARDGVVILPLPFDVPQLTLSLFWHARRHNDPAHIWLRNAICEGLQGAFRNWQAEQLHAPVDLSAVKQMRPLPPEAPTRKDDAPREFPRVGSFYPGYRAV
ncbi:DNA-binding transcriptional regulator, LysR family [Andreprevotia lacus DSM 23236]|jgi:DNA-binding transcriptional LysR family regulator|uniref:DNA-binding transcriptional regulator, LysR family n=1 Tax=Andreprevotia lacus DSM 23236 TaxID=1121001 RepID=A0A1W1XSM2_9NEIS|nr:LysR family transcriptional regulator [Andreprevotia lacus]SMC26855.1 DNA-binding transcriptional regulator, LysR family [Andreprevotia lacus DSM 23236]